MPRNNNTTRERKIAHITIKNTNAISDETIDGDFI